MARRQESIFASIALGVLFAMTLLYGCRAFDPEPVVLNRPPDTFIIGAAAETTGSVFRRHMFWYGTDRDGEVVRYIWAVTDSIARDIDEPDTDEEDALFDPADDVTTLVPTPRRQVGWTTQSDSTFVFTIDAGPVQTKRITFHIVSVDDLGGIDPTPARLQFFNNSLGNPVVYFRVYVDEAPVGSLDPIWELRWVGTTQGPLTQPLDFLGLPASPERTSQPFVGFNRRFKIEWVADSPNGAILGYRFKARQGIADFTPGLGEGGKKLYDLDLTEFVYQNAEDPNLIGGDCDPDPINGEVRGCPPETVRFWSGDYLLQVEAIDEALVETENTDEALVFQVNYPPETHIERSPSFPRYRVEDDLGNVLASGSFADGDTVPSQAFVEFRSEAFDRIADALPDSFGDPASALLCCDERLDPSAPEVRYQSRLELVYFNSTGPRTLSGFFQGDPLLDSTIGFFTEGMDYEFIARAVDEHRRPDPEPDALSFFGGFPPQITEVFPGAPVPDNRPGFDWPDTLLIRSPFQSDRFSENEVDYELDPSLLTWTFIPDPEECGGRYEPRTPDPAAPNEIAVSGNIYRFRPRFVGQGDPRDPLSAVRAWSYALFSENDPDNTLSEGPGESKDLSVFIDSPVQPNRWDFTDPGEAIEIFIPFSFWFNPTAFEPGGVQSTNEEKQGCELLRQLGEMTLRVRGKSTDASVEYKIFRDTKYDPNGEVQSTLTGQDFDRRSDVAEAHFWALIGIEQPPTTPSDPPQRYWPDF